MRKLITALVIVLLAQCAARAQYETQLVALIDKRPVVVEAPYPFVEASRILPEAFAQRRRSISAANRLVAWYIPTLALKDQLNDKTERYRSLQIQIMKEMEPVRYTTADLAAMRDELIRTTPGLAQIGEDDTDTLFNLLDLSRLGKKAGGQKILGLADLGPDSFTLCIATSAEGRDQRGGREIESSIACVTHLLINEKILLLTVSGPDLTAKELRNAIRLTREWIALLRAHNNAPAS
jgi:hypothetical protein